MTEPKVSHFTLHIDPNARKGEIYFMGELKTRDVVLRIILTFITCGLFGLYWMKTLTDDIHRFSERPQTPSGIKVMLLTLVTCTFYFYYWLYKISDELVEARREKGLPLDAVSNTTYTVTVIVTSPVSVLFSILHTLGDLPPRAYQELSDGKSLAAGIAALFVISVFWLVVQTIIAGGILWIVYRRKNPHPRILYMLLAIFRIQIFTIAFLQASLNDGISSQLSLKNPPPEGPGGTPPPTEPMTTVSSDLVPDGPSPMDSAPRSDEEEAAVELSPRTLP